MDRRAVVVHELFWRADRLKLGLEALHLNLQGLDNGRNCLLYHRLEMIRV